MPSRYETIAEHATVITQTVGGQSVNVYILGEPGNALLIDSGDASQASDLIATLQQLGHEPGAIRAIVITHPHSDHYGGAGEVAAWSGAEIWTHPVSVPQIEDPWGHFNAFEQVCLARDLLVDVPDDGSPAPDLLGSAADPDRLLAAWKPWATFVRLQGPPVRVARLLRDGDRLDHAGFNLQVLHTPGHDRGCICLFEARRRLLFSGDVIQGSLVWLGNYPDPARQRSSLARLASLNAAIVCGGHRVLNSAEAIRAALDAGRQRLDDIANALLATLAEKSPQPLGPLVWAATSRVLKGRIEALLNTDAITTHAALMHLARLGRIRQTPDLLWHRR